MKKSRAFNKFFNVFASLSLAVLLICGSITIILAAKPLYPLFRGELSNPYELSLAEIEENYNRLVDYNLRFGSSKLEFLKLPMSEEGRRHFVEVREIFQMVLRLLIASAVILLLLTIPLIRRSSFSFLRNGAVLALSLPVLLSLPLLLDFSRAFTLFHQIFFSNDYWLFDPQMDPVICYLQESFFMKMALCILALLLLLSLLCLIAFRHLRAHKN